METQQEREQGRDMRVSHVLFDVLHPEVWLLAHSAVVHNVMTEEPIVGKVPRMPQLRLNYASLITQAG